MTSDGKQDAVDAAPAAPAKEKRPRDPALWIHRPMEKYRKGKHALAFRPDQDFFRLADPVVKSGRTLLGYDRLYVFWQAIRNVHDLPGAAAEIGSFRGGSAFFIASCFQEMCGGEVPVHVFDTFEGHPGEKITEHDPFHTAGQFGATSYDDVREYLSAFTQLQVHKGEVSRSLPGLPESAYRLVHIDTDLYEPTLDCLDYFAPRMVPGGVFVMDDYASGKCPGVPRATVEFLERTPGFQAWDMRTEQLMLVKR
ncbi:MAG: TylF/MycF/NovP-related O-methyltransferase [Vicinamibacterales bacterium]